MTGAMLAEPVSGPQSADPAKRQRSARRTLALLVTVCVLPVLASYLAYYVWQPQGRVNYGELLMPAPLPPATLPGLAEQSPFASDEFHGRWTLVFAGPAACDAACAQSLYAMRQSRLAQGEDMERVARLWLVADGGEPSRELVAAHEGLRVAQASADWLARLPATAAGRHVHLVDPLGNPIMRFPADADPARMIKDLRRLLKYSQLDRVRGER